MILGLFFGCFRDHLFAEFHHGFMVTEFHHIFSIGLPNSSHDAFGTLLGIEIFFRYNTAFIF